MMDDIHSVKGASKKLGELLVREEVLTREQLEEALREQKHAGQFLGEILVRLKYITEEELVGFLVRQCRIPHLKLSNFQIAKDVAELVPAAICREYKLLAIDKLGTLLTIAMVNPLDVEALEKIKKTVSLRIKPILCSWVDFRDLYDRIYGAQDRKAHPQESAPAEVATVAAEPKQPAAQTVAPTEEGPRPPDPDKEKSIHCPGGLIERFTFDSFVVAQANSFTYALARSIAESPGSEYNPFFIYGNTGLGKTHLSNAIGNEVVRSNNDALVVYAPASQFIDEMIEAVEHEKMKEFRDRYANVDMLILDDIQFLAGRTRAQEEFFNVFNLIYGNKKHIILVSDVSPKRLEGLEKRLISRFEGGVVACVEEPDFQTRLGILRQRTGAAGATVPEDVLDLLAKSIPSNIRELEGALKKLLAYSSLVGHEITVELAQEILKHMFKTAKA
ncbi:ATP-binding protein [Candidatus Poribacteria bacterium]|nr:ATP-binding protein [Candidatus Poribacteria bacterium]